MILQESEKKARTDEHPHHPLLNYDDSKSFTIDCQNFVPIYNGSGVECSYCGSTYADPDLTNQMFLTCTLCTARVKTIAK